MKFLFGSKDSFAIALSIDESSLDEWLNGDVFIYIDGSVVNKMGVYLTSMVDFNDGHFKIFDNGRRKAPFLCNLMKDEVFRYLDNALYGLGADGQVVEPARFNISMNVDTFDHIKMFLIECCEGDRLIYKIDWKDDIYEKKLDPGFAAGVIKGFYDQLNELAAMSR